VKSVTITFSFNPKQTSAKLAAKMNGTMKILLTGPALIVMTFVFYALVVDPAIDVLNNIILAKELA